MSAGREVVVIDGTAHAVEQPAPASSDEESQTEEAIDLDEWAAEDDVEDLTTRLTRIAKQMEQDALLLPRGHMARGPLLKDAAAILGRLLDKREPNAKPDAAGSGLAPPTGRGGVAVAQVGRDDAVSSYLRLIEGGDSE